MRRNAFDAMRDVLDRTREVISAMSDTVTTFIPRELRAYCDGASELVLAVPNVRALLEELERRHPSLYRSICNETGAVRPHINIFVNATHMRARDGLNTALAPGDEVIIVPAVSGG